MSESKPARLAKMGASGVAGAGAGYGAAALTGAKAAGILGRRWGVGVPATVAFAAAGAVIGAGAYCAKKTFE